MPAPDGGFVWATTAELNASPRGAVTLLVEYPGAVATGDFILLGVHVESGSGSAPSASLVPSISDAGWSTLSQGFIAGLVGFAFFSKIADGTETGESFTLTRSTNEGSSSRLIGAVIGRFDGSVLDEAPFYFDSNSRAAIDTNIVFSGSTNPKTATLDDGTVDWGAPPGTDRRRHTFSFYAFRGSRSSDGTFVTIAAVGGTETTLVNEVVAFGSPAQNQARAHVLDYKVYEPGEVMDATTSETATLTSDGNPASLLVNFEASRVVFVEGMLFQDHWAWSDAAEPEV